MAAGYPIAFYNMALAIRDTDNNDPTEQSKAAAYMLQAFNRVMQCCWTPVARHLLADEPSHDQTAVRRAVRELTLWAAALGSASSRDLLTELVENRAIAPTDTIANAAFSDSPPWLRADTVSQTH